MPEPPPLNLMDWPKKELVEELKRLRAITREMAERPGTDPTEDQSPNSIIDAAGDPHAKGGVLLDLRSGVLMDEVEVALADTKANATPVVVMRLQGRVNYSAKRVDHVYIFDADGAAAIISELAGLMQRSRDPDLIRTFAQRVEQRMSELP